MNVTQIHTLVNAVTESMLGESAVLQEDLSNVVDVGNAVFGSDQVDNYVKKLVNQIGKIAFVNRSYSGSVPSVLMDSWEYGSVLEKVSAELPVATENESWDLTNGTDYSPDVFYKPSVNAKFFNSKTSFEIPLSFTEKQIKESFLSPAQLNGFLSMLTTSVENSMTVKLDGLIMRTINNMIASTCQNDLVEAVGDPAVDTLVQTGKAGTNRAVNLLYRYNTQFSKSLTATQAITDPDFIRYATYVIGLFSDRMARVSTLFNVSESEKFTPKDQQHIVLLSDFAVASETYLQADTFNSGKVVLPKHESVPYWQGSGTDYSLTSTGNINVTTSGSDDVDVSGIVGVMFDRYALGVTNLDRRVTTNYNPKAEFYTNFYKFDAGFFNDLDENFVVFYVA